MSIVIQISIGQVAFVAVGADITINNGRNIAYSTNGINWTVITANIFSVSTEGVAHSAVQNKWIAVGQGTVNTMAWSADGITWTGLGLNCFNLIGTGITYSPEQNRWVAAGNGPNSICYSTDGLIWTTATVGIFSEAKSVVYSSALNQWVAVGQDTNTIATSSDGITWTGLGNLLFVNGAKSIRYGNGVYVITGNGAVTQGWSSDGITWTSTPEFIAGSREDSVFAQGEWILVGPASVTFQNSTNGRSWTNKANFAGINNVFGITYNSAYNRYVAIGTGLNTIIYSSDGDNWNGAGALFTNWGFKVATTGSIIQPIINPTPITADVVNLITNTSIVNRGVTIIVSGNLTVLGDLVVDGQWILAANSIVNVSGILSIKGNTTFNALNPINCQLLVISSATGDSKLEVPLNVNLTLGNSVSYPVITYTTRSGSFNSIKVRSAPTVALAATDCPVASQDYSSSTLTVTVTMTRCGGNLPIENFAVRGSPMGMIVGIAVGCAVLAAVVILVVVVLMRQHRDRADAIANSKLRENSINDLKVSTIKPNPAFQA